MPPHNTKMKILEYLKGGINKMARNLVDEKKEENLNTIKEAVEGKKEQEIQIITEHDFIVLKLQQIEQSLNKIESLMREGFKQVGVAFKE